MQRSVTTFRLSKSGAIERKRRLAILEQVRARYLSCPDFHRSLHLQSRVSVDGIAEDVNVCLPP